MDYKKDVKNVKKFICEDCSFSCNIKYNFNKHLDTRKHKMITNNAGLNVVSYSCVCGKEYKHRQGLYTHKKKCPHLNNNTTVIPREHEPQPQNEIVTVLLEQNTMFQELLLKNEEEKKQRDTQMLELYEKLLETLNKSQ